MDNKRILGIDYGTVRIGIGLSDKTNKYAIGLEQIANKNKEFFVTRLKSLIKEYNIGTLVFGVPLNRDGNETKMSKLIKNVGKSIAKDLEGKNIKIEFWNESLTSLEAMENLRMLGSNVKKMKNKIDKEAARIFLQEFLDNL